MTSNYDLGKIRTLLTEGFSDEELRTLAFDEPGFKPVFHQLAHRTGKTEIVSHLLEHAGHTAQFDQLLAWAKSHNPAQYAVHEPYFYDDSAAASPYPGLQYFDVGDAERFFGRELLTAKLVGRLTPSPTPLARRRGGGSRFLAVVGASGSGKSSVVRAGLVPALQRGQPLADESLPPEGCTQWPIHIITPTAHPLEALAASLTRDAESVTATTTLMDDMSKDARSLHLYVRKLLSRGAAPTGGFTRERRSGGEISSAPLHLLLVVDQFEELFTLCRSEAERRVFVDNLLTAVGAPSPSEARKRGSGGGDGPTLVIITLRADFYDYCGQFANLREALARYQEYIGPMSIEELRRAIELPAERAGYEFEPGLVDLILRDVGDEPGALPLLSHALLETWRRRQGRTLTLAGYAEAGGVRQAIAQTAEAVFGNLTPEQQSIARHIFLRLTELGEGTQDTRRRVSRAELEMMTGDRGPFGFAQDRPETGASDGEQAPVPGHPSPVSLVLQTLVAARLVTTDQATAEVAHEALIREWPTLRQWLNDNREGLRLHRQLSEAAQEWQRLNHDLSMLYRGAKLAQASEWAEKHPEELNPSEQQFLTASKQAEENERQRELAQARALAEEQQRRAEAEQLRAEEQRQAAARLKKRALVATAIGVIALIAAIAAAFFGWRANESAKLAATREAEAKRQEAEAKRQADVADAHRLAAEGRLQFEEKPLLGLRLALEGWALSTAYDQIDQFIRDMAQHGRLLTLGRGDVEVIYTPDNNPSIFLIDRANDTLGELCCTPDGTLIAPLSGPVDSVSFSPDEAGSYFVVHYSDNTPSELRRTADGALVAPLSGPVIDVTFSPDKAGSYFVVRYSGFTTPGELRRTANGTVVEILSGPVFNVTFSPDEAGSYFVVSYYGKTPGELRRTANGALVAPLSGPVESVSFSTDKAGRYFVVDYSGDTPGELHRTADGALITPLSGPIADFGVTFSPDKAGRYFVVGYSGNTGELRRTTDGTVVEILSGLLFDVTFSPDEAGSYFVVSYYGNTPAELRRTADGGVVSLPGLVANVIFSPDEAGSYFVVRYSGFTTPGEVRRTANGTLVETLSGPVDDVTFSSDKAGRYFVVSYYGNTGELRRTADGQVVAPLSGPVESVSFSPDEAGRYFVVSYYYGDTPGELRRTADGQVVAPLSGPVADDSITFSPDEAGTYFIVAYADGQSELWQAQNEPRRLAKLGLGLGKESQEGFHFDVANDRLITWYTDGRAYLLDLAWLRAMGGKADKMPIKELVRLACEGPFASGLFDEAELKPYLGEREPQACKK